MEQFLAQLDNLILGFFAVGAVFSGLLMLTLREPMRVAIALVSAMVFLGGIYGLVGAHFIAAFQILIYVGAVMVFMIYVIMLLNVRDSSVVHRYSRVSRYAVGLAAALMVLLIYVVLHGGVTEGYQAASYTVKHFAKVFMNEYWFQFQLIAVLLLVAVVAAIALLKPPPTTLIDPEEAALAQSPFEANGAEHHHG